MGYREFRLKIRLFNGRINDRPIRFDITKSDIAEYLSKYRPDVKKKDYNKYFDDFAASVSIIPPMHYLDLNLLPQNILYDITSDEDLSIGIIQIETNTKFKNLPLDENISLKEKFPIDQYIISTAQDILKKYNTEVDFLRIIDHATKLDKMTCDVGKLWHFINKPTQKIYVEPIRQRVKDKTVEGKYRLYLDDTLLIERYYPKDLWPNEQLEEELFVNIEPGLHTVKIENIGKQPVHITEVIINGQAFMLHGFEREFKFE